MKSPSQTVRLSPMRLRTGEQRGLLIVGDILVALISLALALVVWGSTLVFIQFDIQFLVTRIPVWFYLLPVLWVLLLIELYDVRNASDWGKTVRSVIVAAIIGLGLYLLLFFIYAEPSRASLPRLGVATFLIIVVVLTLAWHWFYIRLFSGPRFLRRVLLVGGGESGKVLLRIYSQLKNRPFNLIGIVDDDPHKLGELIEGVPVLGGSEYLLNLIAEHQISDLVVAITGKLRGSMFQALLDANDQGIDITRMPVAYEEMLGRVPIRILESDWILRSFVDEARVSNFYELAKRLVDILGGLVGTLIMLVLLPIIFLAVLLDDGLPLFYTQTRSGRRGELYPIFKFRTMRRDAEANGLPQWASEKDNRTTRVGRILRKTHLDELPQFYNVLRGEMSLVGPRAERPELVTVFEGQVPFYRARLLVKPGITGWAQINFGYASSVEDTMIKLEYDLYYIKHRSLSMDFLVLLRTPAMMLGFRGR